MKKIMGLGVMVSVLLASCAAPSNYTYQRGPQQYIVLASAKTLEASQNKAIARARIICFNQTAAAQITKMQQVQNGLDAVTVQNNYLYVIGEQAPTDFFEIVEFNCVPLPKPGATN